MSNAYWDFNYEAPGDQSIAVQNQRAEYSTNCYDDFSGSPPIARRLPIWLLAYISNR